MTEFVEWSKDGKSIAIDEYGDNYTNLLVIPLSPLSVPLAEVGIEMGYRVVSPNDLYLGDSDNSNLGLAEDYGSDYAVGTVQGVRIETAGGEETEYTQEGLMGGHIRSPNTLRRLQRRRGFPS